MKLLTPIFSLKAAVAAGLLFSSIAAATAEAASINYGSLGPVGPGVTFIDITESSGTDAVPLYGPPTAFVTGLSHAPTGSFSATSSGVGADLTDGQLNYTVAAPNGVSQISLSEGGAYTFTGVGTIASQVFAGASLHALVTEIDGVAVAPINLTSTNSSVSFNALTNPGIGAWQVNLSLDVASQLAGLGYGAAQATRVDVVIDNQLVAVSELLSTSSISKNEFVIIIDGEIPEPSSFGLAALGLCGLGAAARKRA